MNPFKLKPVPSSARDEIKARANTTTNNLWFATRTNWVHVMSFCEDCDASVVQLSNLSNAAKYSDGDTYTGKRPNPVIQSVDVKAQGNLGTTRSCVVKMIAFTEAQAEALAKCYGVPGMSVRVQFGWNRGAGSSMPPGPLTKIRTDNEATCAINSVRNTYPCYDGLQGIVGKWAVSFNKDNMWWEFTLDITAASSPVMTRPLEDMSSPCYCEQVQQNPENGETKTESMGTSQFRAKIIDWIENSNSLPAGVYSVDLNHGDRDQLGGASGGMFSAIADFFGTPETTERYVTLGTLMSLVNDYCLSQTDKGPLMAKFDATPYGLLSYKEPGYSSDPDTCLFPGLDIIDYDGTSAPSCKTPQGIDASGILINCIFVNKCIEDIGKAGSIQDFFAAVFRGITDASAGLFELSIVDTGCDDGAGQMPTLSVIDLQKVDKSTDIYIIPGGPDKAVIRDVKLDLELTDAMKSQVLYGGVRQNANSTPCDEKRFLSVLRKSKNKAAPQVIKKPKQDCPENCDTQEEHKSKKPTIKDDYEDLIDEITSAKKETVRSRLVEHYNKDAEKDLCKDVILPYKFSFTMDGIGGLAFGQAISSNLIPGWRELPLVFQITSVEQSITYGDWTTTISTVGRLK